MLEITEYRQVEGMLYVAARNPNASYGLIRSGFSLTAFADDGSVVAVHGQQGIPGALNTTIYQLPPSGDFYFNLPLPPATLPIVRIELVPTDPWIDWGDVDAPNVTVSNTSILDSGFGPTVTGQAAVDQESVFNVWVGAITDGPLGLAIATGAIECVAGSSPRGFEVRTFSLHAQDVGPYSLRNVIAYTTTIPGVGAIQTPPGC